MVEFASGKLSQEDYRARMLSCTTEQLALLTNDPEFHAWQAQKAARENKARAASNVLAAVGCVLLVVTLALLKPAAGGSYQQVRRNHCLPGSCLPTAWATVSCSPGRAAG